MYVASYLKAALSEKYLPCRKQGFSGDDTADDNDTSG